MVKKRKTGKDLGEGYLWAKVDDMASNRRLILASPYYRLSLFEGSDESATNNIIEADYYQEQKALSYDVRELKAFNFFVRLEDQVSMIENDLIYFIQDFNQRIELLSSIQLQLRIDRVMTPDVWRKLGIQGENSLYGGLFPERKDVKKIWYAYNALRLDLTFFNAMNRVYEKVDEYLEISTLCFLKVEVDEYAKAMDRVNDAFEKLMEDEGIKNEIGEYYSPFEVDSCMPTEEAIDRVLERIGLMKESSNICIEALEEAVLEIGYECGRRE